MGTEHIAVALSRETYGKTADAFGVSTPEVRAALDALDDSALRAIGPEPVHPGPVFPGRLDERLPLTPAAKAVLTGLRTQAGRERIGVRHVLLSLLDQRPPDPAAQVLDQLRVDRAAIRRRLGESS